MSCGSRQWHSRFLNGGGYGVTRRRRDGSVTPRLASIILHPAPARAPRPLGGRHMPPSPLKIVLALVLVLGRLVRGSAAIGCARRPGRDTGRRDEKERHAVPRPKAAKRVKSPHAAPDRKSPRARPRPFHIRCYPPAHPTPHPLRKLRWLSQRWYGESRCIGFVIAVGAGDRISEVVSSALSMVWCCRCQSCDPVAFAHAVLFQRSSPPPSSSSAVPSR